MPSVITAGAYKPTAPLALPGEVMDICAGPGGWDEGARILGLPPMVGVELDRDACETGRAAGHRREQVDMRRLAPTRYHGVRGAVLSPPCPTFSASGLRSGVVDMQTAEDAITCLGCGCGCEWPDLPERVADPRTALVVEAARWALLAPDLEWFAAEQVPAVEPLWESLAAELAAAGWETFDVLTVEAADYGVPSRRRRTFVYGRRTTHTRVSIHDAGWKGADLPRTSMADALGWEPGVRVWTRGERKTSGGNAFSADGPSWCLTGSSRSWKVGALDGPELTASQAGLLNGFRSDYPWCGSRTRQFLQIADVVTPVIAAVVLGVVTNTPWAEPVRAYLAELYPTRRPVAVPIRDVQLQLFGELVPA